MINKINEIKIIIFFLLVLVIFFIKIYYLDIVFIEFDDAGPFLSHKFYPNDKNINFFNFNFLLSKEFINQLEDSIFFPAYIAFNWTYAPGHYIFFTFFNISGFEPNTKLFFIRIFSLIYSAISIGTLFYFLNKELKVNTHTTILVCSILANSLNFNLYSMHGSPYTTYLLSTLLGVILANKSFRKKNILPVVSMNSLLIFFNYLNVIFYLIFLFSLIKDKKFFYNFKLLYKKKKYIVINLLTLTYFITIILLKYFQDINLTRGQQIYFNSEIYSIIKQYLIQLSKSINFLFYGALPNFNSELILSNFYFANIELSSILIFFLYPATFMLALLLLKIKKKESSNTYICCLIYLFIWTLLYFFNKLPLDASRHSLIYFPLLLILFAIVINFNCKKIKFFYAIISIFFFINGIFNLKIELEKRRHNYYNQIKIIENQNIKNIFLYEDAIWIKNFLKTKDYNLFDFNFRYYRKLKDFNLLPDEVLMIGQNNTFETFREHLKSSYQILKDKDSLIAERIIKNYEIQLIYKEINSVHFSYASKIGSARNNFYLYKLRKY